MDHRPSGPRGDAVLGTAAPRLSGQPAGRPALAPPADGVEQLAPEPHHGQTHGNASAPRRVGPPDLLPGGGIGTPAADEPRRRGSKLTVVFPSQLNVGLIQESQKPNGSFRGCLENLLYNNLNLIELAKRRAHQVSTVVSPSADSLFYPQPELTRDSHTH